MYTHRCYIIPPSLELRIASIDRLQAHIASSGIPPLEPAPAGITIEARDHGCAIPPSVKCGASCITGSCAPYSIPNTDHSGTLRNGRRTHPALGSASCSGRRKDGHSSQACRAFSASHAPSSTVSGGARGQLAQPPLVQQPPVPPPQPLPTAAAAAAVSTVSKLTASCSIGTV